MAVPGPPLLALLSLLLPLLLSDASAPAAAYTLTGGRQPQHKLLHLGESEHVQTHTGSDLTAVSSDLKKMFILVYLLFILVLVRLAEGLWNGSLQTQHG